MLTTVPVQFTTTLAGLEIDLLLQGTKIVQKTIINNLCRQLTHQNATGIQVKRYLSAIVSTLPIYSAWFR